MVRLYLPRYSTTKAICCGTTVRVFASMRTTMSATTMAPKPKGISNSPLLLRTVPVGVDHERQPFDPVDARALSGRNDGAAAVYRVPGAAAKLEAAALAGRELRGQDHGLALRAQLDVRQLAPDALINSAAKRDQRHDGEQREQRPLRPIRRENPGDV